MNGRRLIGMDTETGGREAAVHALLSVGLALPGRVETIYIRPAPGLEVEPEAALKNGYTEELWEERVAMDEGAACVRVLEMMDGEWVRMGGRNWLEPVAHNAGFDRRFLGEAMRRHGLQDEWDLMVSYRWRCSQATLQACMDAEVVPRGSASLDRLMDLCGIPPRDGVHEAGEDAVATLRGYEWLLEKMRAGAPSKASAEGRGA